MIQQSEQMETVAVESCVGDRELSRVGVGGGLFTWYGSEVALVERLVLG